MTRTMSLSSGTINSQALQEWAKKILAAGYKVIAPAATGSAVEYVEWKDGPMALDQGLPKLSPKAAWFPRAETVLKLRREGQKWIMEDPPMDFPNVVIFGARPCDAIAKEIQAALFGWDFKDKFFEERCKKVFFVTVSCTKPVDNACFCTSVKVSPSGKGIGEVVLTPLGEGKFALTANTEKGEELVKLGANLEAAPEKLEEVWQKCDEAVPVKFDPEKVHEVLKGNFGDAELWDKTSRGCQACGTCAFSCPVCHCFDLQDEMRGDHGIRQKNWDACTMPLFTLHTSGHNPRPSKASRWRQRLNHKFYIYPEKFGKALCTGCGRCLRLCPGGLDLLDTLQQIEKSEVKASRPVSELILDSPGTHAGEPEGSENIYRSFKMKVKEVIDETHDVRTLRLEFADPEEGKKFTHKVGQFGLYGALGEGESTFCIASSPERKEYIECTFRQAGRVTTALRQLEAGDELGFRGPYGNSFPTEQWKGKNIVFVGGGIGVAPVRSVLQYCLDKRDDFGKLTVLFGARTWADHCYKREMDEWRNTPNLKLHLCVDWKFGPQGPDRSRAAEEGWDPLAAGKEPGEKTTCFVPELITAANPGPENTVAVVCGPPIMINLAVKALEALGFSQDSIYATLENRMKCGLGKCGRCNVGPVYVCKEGPVFTAAQLNSLPPDS